MSGKFFILTVESLTLPDRQLIQTENLLSVKNCPTRLISCRANIIVPGLTNDLLREENYFRLEFLIVNDVIHFNQTKHLSFLLVKQQYLLFCGKVFNRTPSLL